MNTRYSRHGRFTLVPIVPISKLPLPYYESVSAGFPSPADDYQEAKLKLDDYLIKNPSSTFFVKVEGLSMQGAGIYPGDLLIVDRSLEAKNKDVIVAVIDGEFTVKRLILSKGKVYLKPENKKYSIMEIDEYAQFMVWGVVTHVIHKPYVL